ncbi:MAG: glucosaminidase domain-containing protein [Polyangiaceae bacterium]|jgi:hypothetical protein
MGKDASPYVAPIDSRTVRNVDPCRTPVSRVELRSAIGRAYHRVTGQAASSSMLDTLTAQASLETASGARMYNFNFGGVKGAGPHGETANCVTHEVIGSHDTVVRQGFRAYASIDEGAEDYVRLLSGRFGGALSKAQTGDLDGFAHALKTAGYYTASESDYASALHSLSGQPASAANNGLRAAPTTAEAVASAGSNYSTADDISRVLDVLSSSALRIAGPAHDD